MNHKGVLCDTSFFIRLLDKTSDLHNHARGYFKYFTENDYKLLISTISIAEYCVRGDVNDLPLRNLQILPFNLSHSKRTGELAKIVFDNRGLLSVSERRIIPNDTKLFAQADSESSIEFYISSDSESKKIYSLLQKQASIKFDFIDLKFPFDEKFGILGL